MATPRRRRPALALALVSALTLTLAPKPAAALVDVPAQLYSKYISGEAVASVADIMPATLPSVLTDKLDGADFSELSTYLQRALLWDLGLVFTGDNATLVQVLTVCGSPMSSVFLNQASVELGAGCSIAVCNAQSVYFAAQNCSLETISEVAQCAVEENSAVTAISNNPVWSQDGTIGPESLYQVFYYPVNANNSDVSSSSSSESDAESTDGSSSTSGNASSSDTKIYTINEQGDVYMVDDHSCPPKAISISPCIVLTAAEVETVDVSWCTPKAGGLVDLWLAQEVAALDESKSSEKWMSIAIVFISACGLLLLGIFGWTYRYRSRAMATKSSSRLASSRSPTSTPNAVQYAFIEEDIAAANLDDEQKKRAHRGRKSWLESKSTAKSPESSTSGGVQQANAEICQRSPTLAAFCDDRELLIKKISYRTLRFEKLIAKGANGEVWRGEYDHQEVAIKRLLPEMRDDIRCIEYFSKEIHLASILEHPNVVRFIGVSWRLLPELCMVSELMPQGDLAHYLASPESKQLTWKAEKLALATDIANALVYLHSLMPVIIHRDLKSLNVLLSDTYEAKLSDFGLSRERTFEETMTSGVGTLLWTAPEVLRGDRYSEKADIYSYGVVLSELDTCLPPYKLNDELARGKTKSFELLPMIRNGRISPKFSDSVPPGVLALAQLCLDQNPERRPNAMQIVYILQSKVLPSL